MLLPRTLATAVDKVARQTLGKDWNLYATLLNHWAEIVGTEYAAKTTPVKISFPRGKPDEAKWAQGRRCDGALHIKLPQGLVMEFTYQTDQIKQRISSYFGYEAIARIVLEPHYSTEQAVHTPPSPEPSVEVITHIKLDTEVIENDELRAALQGLGEHILASDKLINQAR